MFDRIITTAICAIASAIFFGGMIQASMETELHIIFYVFIGFCGAIVSWRLTKSYIKETYR